MRTTSTGPAPPSGPSGRKKITYSTLYDQMVKCFQAVGIQGSSITHLPRSAGAKSLEQKGVSEDQIRSLGKLTPPSPAELLSPHGIHYTSSQGHAILYVGKWLVETVERCYLSSICREACRAQAGFEKEVG